MLTISHLSLSQGQKKLITDLSCSFEEGQCWAILGENGSGKTTLLHAMAGLFPNTSGEIFFQNHSILNRSPQQLAQHIGILFQSQEIPFSITVLEMALLARYPFSDSIFKKNPSDHVLANKWLDTFGLTAMQECPVRQLSGGETQRLALTMLFMQSPDIYLLDEPLNHLDVRYQIQIMQLLKETALQNKKTVIMTLHDISWTIRYCTHGILLFDKGDTKTGTIPELLTQENLERLYRCSFVSHRFEKNLFWLPKEPTY